MNAIIQFLTSISEELYISVVTGLVILLIQGLYFYLRDLTRSPRYKAYVGKYFLYSFHTDGTNIIVESRLEIKKYLGKVKAKLNTMNASYTGFVTFKARNVYIDLEATAHQESVHLVFFDPLFPKVNKLWGIGCCISVLEEPCGLRFLLSRNQLSEEAVKNEFSQPKNPNSKHILLVKRERSLYQDNAPANSFQQSEFM